MNMENNELVTADALSESLGVANALLKRSYLQNLENCDAEDLYSTAGMNLREISNSLSDSIRFEKINRIVLNKKENQRDKLISLYKNIANTNSTVLILICAEESEVDFYIGTKTEHAVEDVAFTLANSLKGNFPGTEPITIRNSTLADKVLVKMQREAYISAVSGIPGLRSDREDSERHFVQGIEKLIDIMQGSSYTMLLIANAKSKADIEASRIALQNLYSNLVPFSEKTYTYGENESDAVNKALTKGFTHTITKNITDSVTHTTGNTHSESDTKGGSVNIGATIGATLGLALGPVMGGIFKGISAGVSVNKSHTTSDSTSFSTAKGRSESTGTSDATSESETTGNTRTLGSSRSIQVKFEDHVIKDMMKRIDGQLKRYDESSDLGMWNCATYFLGETPNIASMAAATYQSLICGKDSSLETDYIINWNRAKSAFVKPFLMHFEHPIFNGITPGTLISSEELSIAAGLPNHSIPGLPVLECAEFGRNVSCYKKNIDNKELRIGKIFHMNHEESLPVKLDLNSLCSHTFITGSTGAGKSNTVYQIIHEALCKGIKFLVIEPAKGEYKNIFGGRSDVTVYGTNPYVSDILKINPFSFPKGIHILEHLDRLVEIFNVCWPMYAAMPAVLKKAIEKSYEDAGWNLTASRNTYSEDFYPTFDDVARNIRSIIDESEYDNENKGAYKGSLITRLTSLTNGLNGQIFVTDEIEAAALFSKNVIIDLSRVGSSETKSLIMGILILKLQEYRMGSASGMNMDLNHITVLEEAHNLLKRTSTEQSLETANLAGKSVEMLTNAIAEMRTYGEGFIIADQAPALLDMAVIRNTNTKIIMRLPDQADRELVGKAANLNEDQISEISRLPCGVAAVYQNNWIEPVLCKIDYFSEKEPFEYHMPVEDLEKIKRKTEKKLQITEMLCNCVKLQREQVLNELRISELEISGVTKYAIAKLLVNPPPEFKVTRIAPIVVSFFPKVYETVRKSYKQYKDQPAIWTETASLELEGELQGLVVQNQLRNDIIQGIITQIVYNEASDRNGLQDWLDKGDLR